MSELRTCRPVVLGGLKLVALACDITTQLEKAPGDEQQSPAHAEDHPADAGEWPPCCPPWQALFRAHRPGKACHLASRSAAAKARARRQGRRSTERGSTLR
jgi:hypothetical protein